VTVPRVAGVRPDGKSEDWGDGGLAIDVLSMLPRGVLREPGAFDARLRVGWDDGGLLVRADVVDATPSESREERSIGDGDSIELFVGTSPEAGDTVQFTIAPGVDGDHAEVRQHFVDHRGSAARAVTEPLEVGRSKTPSGYTVEARVPWDLLRLRPQPGTELALLAVVNDHAPGSRDRRLAWFPERGADWDEGGMHRMRLADATPAKIALAAAAEYDRFRSAHIDLTGVEPGPVRLFVRDKLVAETTLAPLGRLAIASVDLPMPREGDSLGPVRAVDARGSEAWVDLAAPAERSAQLLDELPIVARSAVFDSDDLPGVDFEDRARAEDLLGPYSVKATFYDTNHRLVTAARAPGRYGAVVEVTSRAHPPIRRRVSVFRWPDGKDAARLDPIEAARMLPGLGVDASRHRGEERSASDWLKALVMRASGERPSPAQVLAYLYEAGHARARPSAVTVAIRDEDWWYEQERSTGSLTPYPYLAEVPRGAAADPQRRWPTIVFLHGAGERGDDLRALRGKGGAVGPLAAARARSDFPFIVVAPQCPVGVAWSRRRLEDLMAEVRAKLPVDPDRIYLTGLSLGGFGTYMFAAAHPDWFAAAAPVCAWGDPETAATLRDLPVWAFHGAEDGAVNPELGRTMTRAIAAARGRVRFTLYPSTEHDSWIAAYSGDALYEWFLRQRRGVPGEPAHSP
jgi:predicted esterase